MRINEITSAEDQIELWKLISNSVWQSIQQQQQAEAKRKAETASKRKALPKAKRAPPRLRLTPLLPKTPTPQVTKPKQPPTITSTTGTALNQVGTALGYRSLQPRANPVNVPKGFPASNQNQEFPDEPQPAINKKSSDRQA